MIATGATDYKFDDLDDSDIHLAAYPVPALSTLNIAFTAIKPDDLALNLYNVSGQIVYSSHQHILAGAYTTNIDLTNYSSGTYFLSVQVGNQITGKKVTIIH